MRRAAVLFALIAILTGARPAFPRNFSVKDYGAKGDGTTLDTAAIQKAIDAAAQSGGGTIIVPSGTYLSGSLFVKSHTTLRIERGATILGSQHLADYPRMPTRVAGIEMVWPAALINVYEQTDAKITGPGLIDGDGKVFWESYWALRRQYDSKGLRWAADYDDQRPRLIQIYKSTRVQLSNLTLHRSGFWTVHICYSDGVTVNGVTIDNNIGGKGPSTDGIDIDSSRHILVEHADITDNDDDLCLKAGRDSDGLRVNRPTEDVVLRDSVIRAGAAGVTIGSETSGGFRNIQIYNLKVLAPVPNGILFKSAVTRGGWTDNIRIHNLDLEGVRVPIHITLNWNPQYSYAKLPPGMTDVPAYWKVLTTPVPRAEGLAHFRNVWISDIHATDAQTAFEVSAYPDAPLQNFHLSNIRIQAKNAGTIENAQNWTLTGVHVQTPDNSRIQFKNDTGIECHNSDCR
ncbi:MAG TPA: glycosyl hydrolase family 28 protein [Acidobacteriaceae bacterium]|nr:glycosyl hydrolase family 28 protein [Acidobacteriaceae bacterium]